MTQELEAIQKEAREDPDNIKSDPKKTFAFRFLKVSKTIVYIWCAFAGVALAASILLAVIGKSELPGLTVLYGVAGAIAAAFVGGEKIAANLRPKTN